MSMTTPNGEHRPAWREPRIAELIAELPPAPEGWVRAAQELPEARRSLDRLVARALADASYRAEVVAGLEQALERAGHAPDPRTRAIVRARLEAGAADEG